MNSWRPLALRTIFKAVFSKAANDLARGLQRPPSPSRETPKTAKFRSWAALDAVRP